MPYYVYILHCSDNSYYTGFTNDIERRFREHTEGIYPQAYTYTKRPLALVFTEQFQYLKQALAFEKQLKGWSRRKKDALIKRNYEKLKLFAQCQNASNARYKK